MGNEIWVLLEEDGDGNVLDAALEILSEAKQLAGKTRLELAVISASRAEDVIPVVQPFGPNKLFAGEGQGNVISPQSMASILKNLLSKSQPKLILAPETIWCHQVLAEVSASGCLPFLANCVGISWDGTAGFKFEQHWYSDRVAAILQGRGSTVLASLRPGLFNIKRTPGGSKAQVEMVDSSSVENGVVKLLEFIKADPRTVDLSEAEIIVSGGRGMGTGENFQRLWELADLLGAAVGGSRIARDNGWVPLERQIGQTGKVVSPKLIICCGISGAMQHTFGMKDAKTIIAINKDKNAPIFKLADAGIVGDVQEVIPALIQKLKKSGGN